MKKLSAAFPTSTSTICAPNSELNIELFISDNDEVNLFIQLCINIRICTYMYILIHMYIWI
jgi:hypothetical protein